MPFPILKIKFSYLISKIIQKKVSLQVQYKPKISNVLYKGWEKVLSFTSIASRGSVTIEAAISLVLLLFFSISLMYPLEMMRMQTRMQMALEQVGKDISQYVYIKNNLPHMSEDSEGGEIVGEIGKYIVSGAWTVYGKNQVIALIGKERLDRSCVINGSNGLSFIGSNILADGETIDLVMSYKMDMPFKVFGFSSFSFTQRCRRRAWIGAAMGGNNEAEAEKTVYITIYGTVYHSVRSCSYLNISVSTISLDTITEYRNEGGGKYYPCEKCGNGIGNTKDVYITKWGDRYHGSLGCGGLSRGIMAVPFSQVADWEACKRCGG